MKSEIRERLWSRVRANLLKIREGLCFRQTKGGRDCRFGWAADFEGYSSSPGGIKKRSSPASAYDSRRDRKAEAERETGEGSAEELHGQNAHLVPPIAAWRSEGCGKLVEDRFHVDTPKSLASKMNSPPALSFRRVNVADPWVADSPSGSGPDTPDMSDGRR